MMIGAVSGLLHVPLSVQEAIVSSYRGSKKPGHVISSLSSLSILLQHIMLHF